MKLQSAYHGTKPFSPLTSLTKPYSRDRSAESFAKHTDRVHNSRGRHGRPTARPVTIVSSGSGFFAFCLNGFWYLSADLSHRVLTVTAASQPSSACARSENTATPSRPVAGRTESLGPKSECGAPLARRATSRDHAATLGTGRLRRRPPCSSNAGGRAAYATPKTCGSTIRPFTRYGPDSLRRRWLASAMSAYSRKMRSRMSANSMTI